MNQQIIAEINALRMNPQGYVKYLDQYIQGFKQGRLSIPGSYVDIILEEGKSVVSKVIKDFYIKFLYQLLEAKKFLLNHKGNLKPLKLSHPLEHAALDHYNDISATGALSHTSSDGVTNYKQRIERYTGWGGSIFEAILYGPAKPAAHDVVLAWVIDDGFKQRPHRKNLFV